MESMAEDRVTLEELTCAKCGLFGCDCDNTRQAAPRHTICQACRRNKVLCICASHVTYTPVREEFEDERTAVALTQKEKVDAVEREFLRYYYDTRDAAAIVRRARELATLAYGR